MPLPEVPDDTYQFRIEKIQGDECVFVKLMQRRTGNRGLNDYLVSEIPVSTNNACRPYMFGSDIFIRDVERAAQTLLDRLERDILVKDLVRSTWGM